ncbi:MAG: hypothetical protein EA401_13205 [Planctomycetota bacterium]|nr:MAG: hypothetical protein EA401_13205 [Planctomycetota bacterium]
MFKQCLLVPMAFLAVSHAWSSEEAAPSATTEKTDDEDDKPQFIAEGFHLSNPLRPSSWAAVYSAQLVLWTSGTGHEKEEFTNLDFASLETDIDPFIMHRITLSGDIYGWSFNGSYMRSLGTTPASDDRNSNQIMGTLTRRLSSQWHLRSIAEMARYHGEATFVSEGGEPRTTTFSHSYRSFELHAVRDFESDDMGYWFFGVHYSDYSVPTVLRIIDPTGPSKVVREAVYDEDFRTQNFAGVIGVGLNVRVPGRNPVVFIDLSAAIGGSRLSYGGEATSLLRNSEYDFRQSKELGLFLAADLNLGWRYHAYQNEQTGSTAFVELGYKVRAMGVIDDTQPWDAEDDAIYLEMNRYDVLHGPFLSLGFVY